jgi:3-dehydroquinate synthetase
VPTRLNVGDWTEVLVGDELPPVLPERPDRERVAILTQPGARDLAEQVAQVVGVPSDFRVLPDRDEAKTAEVLSATWEWLAGIGLGRADTIVGVGGGAVTDVAGFAAATWMRGIEVVHVPTTLLAAVDASIGGKTGINVAGKNLVGAFWHPTRVSVDVSCFRSLPAPVLREGFAEALKTAYLGDRDLQDLLVAHGIDAPLREVVERSIGVKAAVVGADEREAHGRMVLNYGHTVGHAIERVHALSHGDAVAIGMVAAAAVSARRTGFDATPEHRATLAGLGLPTEFAGIDRDRVRDLIGLDKKRSGAGVRMALLADYQRPVVEVVDPSDLEAALDAITP